MVFGGCNVCASLTGWQPKYCKRCTVFCHLQRRLRVCLYVISRMQGNIVISFLAIWPRRVENAPVLWTRATTGWLSFSGLIQDFNIGCLKATLHSSAFWTSLSSALQQPPNQRQRNAKNRYLDAYPWIFNPRKEMKYENSSRRKHLNTSAACRFTGSQGSWCGFDSRLDENTRLGRFAAWIHTERTRIWILEASEEAVSWGFSKVPQGNWPSLMCRVISGGNLPQ
jgi:hypothetical protein